ncbi:MAG: NAD(P)H-dependent oxidoreductase subunit E [Dehalococcoidia bacterium]|nr:NAD(P)H-dependent oxidoreductase subunit E [Dehalococcoidia bacterium]
MIVKDFSNREDLPLPPISAQDRDRLIDAINHQRRPTVTVLSSLLAVQDELGYIPDEAIEEVATLNDTTINEVWGVASFYTNFRFTPPGNHNVEICWGPTCHLTGAAQILKRVMEQLGLEDEGETEDNNISFKFNTCLGACSNAPVMSIDHHLIGRLTPESASNAVRRLLNES